RESKVTKEPFPLARSVVPVPPGESPDDTGGAPVLPRIKISDTPQIIAQRTRRLHLDRAARGHRHHSHSGGASAAGTRAGQAKRTAGGLSFQSQADRSRV